MEGSPNDSIKSDPGTSTKTYRHLNAWAQKNEPKFKNLVSWVTSQENNREWLSRHSEMIYYILVAVYCDIKQKWVSTRACSRAFEEISGMKPEIRWFQGRSLGHGQVLLLLVLFFQRITGIQTLFLIFLGTGDYLIQALQSGLVTCPLSWSRQG